MIMKDAKEAPKEGLKTYGEKPRSFEFDNNERFYIGSEVCRKNQVIKLLANEFFTYF